MLLLVTSRSLPTGRPGKRSSIAHAIVPAMREKTVDSVVCDIYAVRSGMHFGQVQQPAQHKPKQQQDSC
jgi:hypothetical protein